MPVFAANLSEMYRAAKEQDPVYLSAYHALAAARQRVPQAFSALLPALGASASGGRTEGDTAYTGTPTVERGFNTYNWTLQLSQPVLRLQNNAAYGQAKAETEEALARFEGAEQDMMLRVAEAYFNALVAEEGLLAAEARWVASQEQATAAQRSFVAGVSSITDFDEARADADIAYAERVAALSEVEIRKAELVRISGLSADGLWPLRPGSVIPMPEPAQVEPWLARAREQQPEVSAQRARLAAAGSELDRNRYKRMPVVDLVASYGQNYSSGNVTNPIDFSTQSQVRQLALQVSMPIFDGGGIRASISEARSKQAQAESELEATQRAAVAQAKESFLRIVNGLSQIGALESAVSSGERSVKGNRLGYQSGIRINSDVLDSQQQLYSARRDLSRARYDTLMQCLQLKAAAGELKEADMTAVNALLGEPGPAEVPRTPAGPRAASPRLGHLRLDQRMAPILR